MSCPSHLVLAKLKVDVNIHRAIVGAHLMKDAFLCKAHFFTVIKLLQSKRFNSNCLAHKKLLCSMWHGHFSGFDLGGFADWPEAARSKNFWGYVGGLG